MTAEGYYNRPRREMLAFVPDAARRILDVGCGSGVFGGYLKAERGAEVWGIELDAAAAAAATDKLDRVLQGDVLVRLGELPDGGFDCIVMNDILEHLVAPEKLLTDLRSKLATGGRVVASIPNIRHFPHLWDLVVHGRWDYVDEGLLDRTHLRFYTRRSLTTLFADSGYRLERVAGIHPTTAWRFRLVNLLTLGHWSDMRFLQFACVAAVTDQE